MLTDAGATGEEEASTPRHIRPFVKKLGRTVCIGINVESDIQVGL